ncbi:AlpA family phage regulatory protein [Paucibacter sp. TC2R-5]|uniref:helix-turn-helix transcriptional regulator n=1 Tax=Paucibacter sp. TC2R-5 TaxID=2893555 RepID=UPI0021E3C6F3|nr:AlpA family phage regulatory protein [Paucibacter sp. TC2R-5]MCV2361438.1 AlpA family phage regulatory protein [Paucibacter sp. TC2R-5]
MAHQDPAGAASSLPSTGYTREKKLLQFIPVGRATLWRWVKAGEFPAPLKLSGSITAWRVEDVHAWIAAAGRQK